MKTKLVYLSLGGNIGEVQETFRKALGEIDQIACRDSLKVSSLYRTSPVSDIPQDPYLNCCCCFETTLSSAELHQQLEEVERSLGKVEKEKNLPRPIDIDILFYGAQTVNERGLEIPHPRWKERLFVLIPLLDLTEIITYQSGDQIHTFQIEDLIEVCSAIVEDTVEQVEESWALAHRT